VFLVKKRVKQVLGREKEDDDGCNFFGEVHRGAISVGGVFREFRRFTAVAFLQLLRPGAIACTA
jgi:hypothetical protein